MCEILEVIKWQDKIMVVCTPYDGDFMKTRSVRVFNKNNDVYTVTKFRMSHTTQCFNNNPIAPVFGIEEKISEQFLQKGNKIEFETVIRESKPARKPAVPPKRKPARAAAMA